MKKKPFVLGDDVIQALKEIISINDEPGKKEEKEHESD